MQGLVKNGVVSGDRPSDLSISRLNRIESPMMAASGAWNNCIAKIRGGAVYHHLRRLGWPFTFSFLAMAPLLFAAAGARADLVVLKDGTYWAGVGEEVNGRYVLRVARDLRTPPVTFDAQDVARVLKGEQEAREIDGLESTATLSTLVEQYFAAGLEQLARRCLLRAAERDADFAAQICTKAELDLKTFWNRTLLNHRENKLSAGDAAGLLETARWARRAELTEQSIRLLRRAYQNAPDLPELLEQARDWNVDLTPLLTIDLSMALNQSLFQGSLFDERETLFPKDDARFVAVPFRYRCNEEATIDRRSFDVRAVPPVSIRILGFRPLEVEDGRLVLPVRPEDPIYERLTIVTDPDGRLTLRGVNTVSPVRSGDRGPVAPRIGPTRVRLACNGWAALLVELGLGAQTLKVTTDRTRSEEINLALLETITRGPPHPADTGSPEMRRLLRQVLEGTPAVAEAAIRRLALIRREVPPERNETWTEAVDVVLLQALMHSSETVAARAWRAMVDGGPMPAATLAQVSASEPRIWVLVLANVGKDFSDPSVGAAARMNGLRLIHLALKSDDPVVCAAAVDVLASETSELAPAEAYEGLWDASETARSLALARCAKVSDPNRRALLLRPLLQWSELWSRPEWAALLRETPVAVADTSDPLIERWRTGDAATRAAVLASLQHIEMLAIVRSRIFADLLREAAGADIRREVREHAVTLAIEQARRRCIDMAYGAFPACYPAEDEDPIANTLRDVLVRGPRNRRLSAADALLRKGRVFELDDLLRTIVFPETSERLAFLERLADRPATVRLDALPALLARMLDLVDAEGARRILTLLDALAATRADEPTYRMNLAVKAGLGWPALAALSCAEDEVLADAASRWVRRLSHFSEQDAIQFFATNDRDIRIDRLRGASNRLGRIVGGEYGVLLVLETSMPIVAIRSAPSQREARESLVDRPSDYPGNPELRVAWKPPARLTLPAGTVVFRPRAQGDSFDVLRDGAVIGTGVAQLTPQRIPRPEDWAPSVMVAPETWWFFYGVEDTDARPPLVLNVGLAVAEGARAPATVVMEVGGLLEEVLSTWAASSDQPMRWQGVAPRSLKVRARYVGLGTYAGIGQDRQPLPRRRPDSPRIHSASFVNCAVLLERLDDGAISETALNDERAERAPSAPDRGGRPRG
jgi:hypothetical protein